MQDKLSVGDRVFSDKYGAGVIKSIPVPSTAWVHFDGDEPEYERGISVELLKPNLEGLDYDLAKIKQGSVKKDDNKYDPTMLTLEMVELVSRVRQFGAKKYARNNFKISGFKYTRSLAAALRHIFAFLNGEDNDPESGLSHLGHAVCSIEHCIFDMVNHPENDDRKQ